MKDVSLYVHIPFCASKCSFCSFAVAVNQDQHAQEYLHALDIEAARYQGTALTTIYIGGGTPSHLSAEQIKHVGDMLRARFDLSRVVEMTFECNPESVDPVKSDLLKSIGVTRVSLGIQSFNDRYLSYLGRRHQAEGARKAFQSLRQAGFDNINVDLMYGFRGQTAQQIAEDLTAITALGSEHVSVYTLTIEERSLFAARKEQAPGVTDADAYEQVRLALEAAGLCQYEISNFARPGRESVHNIHYWQGGAYIGIGMAAHSHLSGERSWNADTLPLYVKTIAASGSGRVGSEMLTPSAKMTETMLFGLRLNRGVDVAALSAQCGAGLSLEQEEALEMFMELGLLQEKNGYLTATDRGRLVLDEISARLI